MDARVCVNRYERMCLFIVYLIIRKCWKMEEGKKERKEDKKKGKRKKIMKKDLFFL